MSMMTKAGLDRYNRHRGGVRNGGCHMSCDYMTPKQLKELNGEVHTYQMNKPVLWEQFKKYPVEFQKEYLEHLIAEYNVNYTTLSDMLGVGRSSIKRLIEKNNLGVTFTVGHSMTGEQRKAWKQFLSQSQSETERDAGTLMAPEGVIGDPAVSNPVNFPTMTRFSISFSGRIDRMNIANTLRRMLGDEADGELSIEFASTRPVA